MSEPFEIFLTAVPGLEAPLLREARALGFTGAKQVAGGVTFKGNWPDVWRANLCLRGASKVLARIGSFRAFHLAQLDKRSRAFDWGAVLRAEHSVRVEVTCRKSKIYHDRAAAQRISKAITEELGATVKPEGEITLKARIDDNKVILSVDTSGELLHKRGHKEAVGKAPLRETMAAMLLSECGFTGQEPVLDPMCGSGTFPIEAAEIARNLVAGRARGFAFQQLNTFDVAGFEALDLPAPKDTAFRFYGSDRNAGAITNATANAARAGVADICTFEQKAISDISPPEGPKGLVILNPPYGARIGDKKELYALYGTLGTVLRERFKGWRVGIFTPDEGLARSTKLPFEPLGPVIAHGGIKVRLFRTAPLG